MPNKTAKPADSAAGAAAATPRKNARHLAFNWTPDPWDALPKLRYGDDRSLASVIERQCLDAAPDERAALEDDLLETLAEKDITDAARDFICRQLRLVGGEKSVAALAPLLADARLAPFARLALEAIPGTIADAALANVAGGSATGAAEREGLLGTIAWRKHKW